MDSVQGYDAAADDDDHVVDNDDNVDHYHDYIAYDNNYVIPHHDYAANHDHNGGHYHNDIPHYHYYRGDDHHQYGPSHNIHNRGPLDDYLYGSTDYDEHSPDDYDHRSNHNDNPTRVAQHGGTNRYPGGAWFGCHCAWCTHHRSNEAS